jgi:hypothetical protein
MFGCEAPKHTLPTICITKTITMNANAVQMTWMGVRLMTEPSSELKKDRLAVVERAGRRESGNGGHLRFGDAARMKQSTPSTKLTARPPP